VSRSPELDQVRFNAGPIIANIEVQAIRGVFNVDFDVLCLSMPKGIRQSLPADLIDRIPDERMKRTPLSFDHHVNVDLLTASEVFDVTNAFSKSSGTDARNPLTVWRPSSMTSEIR
jgi:hypothetical protein